MPVFLAGLDAGGSQVAFVDAVDAESAGLHATLAAGGVGLLLGEGLVDEGARLVGTGHHAIAAADTGVFVYQDDAVGAAEGGAGRADIHAGRMFAVLAGQRQGELLIGDFISQVDLTDPVSVLGIAAFQGLIAQAVFFVAGVDAGAAAVGAFFRVDKHAPAGFVVDRLVGGFGVGDEAQAEAGGDAHGAGGQTAEKTPARGVGGGFVQVGHGVRRRVGLWMRGLMRGDIGRRFGRMTFETVDLGCRISVAALAKLAFGVDGRITALLIRGGMAIDATLQAVLAGADAPVHRVVPLVQDEGEVAAAHHVGRLYARFAFGGLGIDRAIGVTGDGLARRAGQQGREQAEGAHEGSAHESHSPMAISI